MNSSVLMSMLVLVAIIALGNKLQNTREEVKRVMSELHSIQMCVENVKNNHEELEKCVWLIEQSEYAANG